MLFGDSAAVFKWRWKSRSWKTESEEWEVKGAEVLVDPLRARANRRNGHSFVSDLPLPPKEETLDFIDPLGAVRENAAETNVTPLAFLTAFDNAKKSEPQLENTLVSEQEGILTHEAVLPGFVPWSSKRTKILEEFTTNEKLSITSSFLPSGVPLKTEISIADRAAHRLEQLDDTSGLKKLADLSQEEYVRNVNELRKNLLTAWANEKKIESVKIIIELSRILASTAAPRFYPSQFVLVTDILDIFGQLVYDRLFSKANAERAEMGKGPLPKHFAVADVPESTRETARNWFYKIGAIMELLPRFYVETTIIECMRFLDPDSLSANLLRLCGIPSSISHPLVASYARAYLCRVAMRIAPADRAPHWKCLNDWMQYFSTQPTALLLPAMEWVVQCVAYNAVSYEDLLPLWEYARMPDKRAIVLRPLLTSLSTTYLCAHALDACKLVTQCEDVTSQELCILGESLLKGETPEDARRTILRSVWRKISKLPSIRAFVECTVVWVEFAARYFSLNETGIIIDTLTKKLTPDKKYQSFYENLLTVVEKLVALSADMGELLQTDSFTQMLALFRAEAVRAKCSTIVLTAFVRSLRVRSSNNFQLANQVLILCSRLHDSLNTSTTLSDRQVASTLIELSLDRFDLDCDPERALEFFVDCRAALSNCDNLVAYVVSRVCSLGGSVVRRGRCSRAGASFMRACIANAFITTASLFEPAHRVRLYLQAGLIALHANSLPQLDAIIKSAVECLASCQDVSVSEFRSLASSLLALLVCVPDSPSRPPLYMFTGFLSALSRYPWRSAYVERGRLLLDCLCFLSTMAQPEFPYRVGNVQSNDLIYGNSAEFLEVIEEKAEIVMGQLEEILQQEGAKANILALELLELTLSIGNPKQLCALVTELYSRCAKQSELKRRRREVRESLARLADVDQSLRDTFRTVCRIEKENSMT